MASWRFQPPLWAVSGAVAGVAVLCALGAWQIYRAQAKQSLLDAYAASAQAPVQPLQIDRMATDKMIHVAVSGRYDAERQLLLDNQSYEQKPGYQVWSPLRLEGGELVLVNRGWVPLTNRNELPVLPAPDGMQHLTGYWQPLPKAGLKLARLPCVKMQKFPQIVNYPSADELSCFLGDTVPDGELLLDPDMPAGYVRAWTFDNGFPPMRHYGYAVQWFALALTLVVIFLKLNLKRIQGAKHE